MTLLKVRNLSKHFFSRSFSGFGGETRFLRAVDGVDLDIAAGSVLGLVGESGCGKSTVGRLILRLIEPTTGSIVFDGLDLARADAASMRRVRRAMQIVFQDPYGALDPRMTVGQTIREPLDIHGIGNVETRRRRMVELLDRVGLPSQYAERYPHEFSGGQRQRVGIARALALNPKLVVCDEAVSALDVSVQAQIVNLLQDLQKDLGLSYLFIGHDLGVVKHISDEVAVMYLGRVVEKAAKRSVYAQPLHPYTRALMSAIPRPIPRSGRRPSAVRGEIPSAFDLPKGCPFHTRCPQAMPTCKEQRPPLVDAGGGHFVACHLYPASDVVRLSAA